MKISIFFTGLLICLCSYNAYGQSDPVLMRINGEQIRKSDFEYAYKKANTSTLENHQSVTDFLQSFIDSKLKVEEAKYLKINENPIFKKEYTTYLDEAQKPYTTDSISVETVARTVYDRLGQNIQIGQLFIAFPKETVFPKDTLEAYKRISAIRQKAIKGDQALFEELVLKFSEDSVSRNASIPGYLGWKTSLMLDPKIEDAMYSIAIDSISQPVRTDRGYHLIKVFNKRPDVGQIKLSHIFFSYPNENPTPIEKDSIRNRAQIIYEGLIDGSNFEKAAEVFSSDFQTATKGGDLGWFGVSNPIPSIFEKNLYNLNNKWGVSEPIEMNYGLHIFKITDKKTLSQWYDLKEEIIQRVSQGKRYEDVKRLKRERLEKLFPYELNPSAYKQLENITRTYHITDTIYFDKIMPLDNMLLLTVGKNQYRVIDFVNFLMDNPSTSFTLSTDILSHKIDDFILQKLQDEQKATLNELYPELRHLTTEYHDGLLLFDVMSQEVWSKALHNTEVLQDLFNENQSKYKWDSPRYKGYAIHAKDKSILKKIENVIKLNSNKENLSHILDQELNSDSIKNIYIEKGLWAKGENAFIDRKIFKSKNDKEIIGYPEFMVHGKLITSPESLDDVKGLVISDYQSIIEKEWIESLRKKYKVEINQDILQTLK